MLIEEYLQYLRSSIESLSIINSFTVNLDKRSDYLGFIAGEIVFMDNSLLMWREFVDVKQNVDRGMYSYQYMTEDKKLVFRYDNVRHHKKLNLPNYPHHKHDGLESNVIGSNAPTLLNVLREIEQLIMSS